jgi:hypothetical protein
MNLVSLARRLWSRRRYLIVALVCACLGGIALQLTSHRRDVGIASASALVDSSGSEVADLGAGGGDPATLAGRASLLASVMTGSPMKDEIARLAGVTPGTVIANPPKVAGSVVSPAPPVPDAPIKPSDPRASILNVSVVSAGQGIELPIIEVETQAPTAAAAARLANASFTALETNVNSTAAANRIPAQSRLFIRPLGGAGFATEIQGAGPLDDVLVGCVLFVLGCCAILGIPWLRTAWHTAAEIEHSDQQGRDASIVTHFPTAVRGEHEADAAFVDKSPWEGVVQHDTMSVDGAPPRNDTLANDLVSARAQGRTIRQRGERG